MTKPPGFAAIRHKAALWVFVCLLGLFFLANGLPPSAQAAHSPAISAATPEPKPGGGSAYDLIALVNQLRSANGLTPFQANAALMAAAQAHSQYQASIGSTTHIGSGGSSVKQRALAAGYGGGADVSVIENIYGGMGASPQNAVSWWQGDGPHLNTLLSTRHSEVGAGIAESGGIVYFTLDVGSVLGGSAPPADSPTQGSPGNPPVADQNPVSTPIAFSPIVLASPKPDGSIVHLVQPGQTLWTIAASYQVALPELLQLNGFSETSLIYPGNQILVKPARKEAKFTAAPLEQTLASSQSAPSVLSTRMNAQSKESATALSSSPPDSTAQAEPEASPDDPPGPVADTDAVWYFVAALLTGGSALIAAGRLLGRAG